MMRREAKSKTSNSLQIQSAVRMNKAMFHAGIHADSALQVVNRPAGESERKKDLLTKLPFRIYTGDEEKCEEKQLYMRIYGAGERAIKKRDGHHRNHRDSLNTMTRGGFAGVVAAVKILANHNTKPFHSNQFGEDLADSGYLATFGPETEESFP